jgi:hypothetical protein
MWLCHNSIEEVRKFRTKFVSLLIQSLPVFISVSSGGRYWVHLVRRPQIGLLYQPRMTDDECGAVGETEVIGESLP